MSAPQRKNLEGDQLTPDAQRAGVPLEDLGRGHSSDDAQPLGAPAEDLDGDHGRLAHSSRVSVSGPEADDILGLWAQNLDDLEALRIATENRLRSTLIEVAGMSKEEATATVQALVKGTADPATMPTWAWETAEMLRGIATQESYATLTLKRKLREHPFGPWAKSIKGLGDKQGARMLAAIGNPLVMAARIEDDVEVRPAERRRGPGQLMQYVGHGDPERSKRRKGEKVQYSPVAKMRVFLVAESVMKQRCKACSAAAKASGEKSWAPPPEGCTCAKTHPFRAFYDRERVKWQDHVHTAPCVRCTAAGQPPAEVGSPVKDAHKQGHALRVVGKEIIKSLWREAERLEDALS